MGLGAIIFLALIQGLTEFLPISSSAHLILPAQLLGWTDQGLAFDVAVHVGTLSAVLLYFREDFIQVIAGWLRQVFRGQHNVQGRLGWFLIWGTLPAVVAGLFLDEIVQLYLRSILVIAITTILFGLLLFWADRTRREVRAIQTLKLRDVLMIGCSQAIALIPGTSRSGITITAGLMLGLTRQAAARFSFYLSAPLIFGAGLYKGVELYRGGDDAQWSAVLLGTLVAALSAYACIHWFLKWLDSVGMLPFVIYRLLLGGLLLVIYATSY
jgi:undecaprenyl-diphosphatase